jgi:hypothetical protein
MRNRLKYLFVIIGVSLMLIFVVMVYNNLFKEPNAIAKKRLHDAIGKECIGIIEEVDGNQASIYYIVNGEKFSFGKVGREKIYYYAIVGDSIIKNSNSKIIEIKKSNSEESKEFEIY